MKAHLKNQNKKFMKRIIHHNRVGLPQNAGFENEYNENEYNENEYNSP